MSLNKQTAVKMPQSREECAEAISQIGRIESQMKNITEGAKAEVSLIQDKAEEKVAPLRLQHNALSQAVQGFCATRKAELTENNKRKFYDFTTGRVNWKAGSLSVIIPDDKLADAVSTLKRIRLGSCLKVTTSINKSSLKALNEKQKTHLKDVGVRFEFGPETFNIKPAKVPVDTKPEARS